jgi:DNA-binding NarL/FixJ family response regulator
MSGSGVSVANEVSNLRILVADDHDIIRRGVKVLLTANAGWEICGEARTGKEAISMAEALVPHIIVMDISMPELNGLDATRRIHKILPSTGILILSLYFSDQLLRDVVEAGARGYVLKSDTDRDLVAAVTLIANGKTFFTACASDLILKDSSAQPLAGSDTQLLERHRLTPREREILQLLTESKTNREVADLLGISRKTVEAHRTNLMRKLQVHSISELVRYAFKNHIIE